MSYYTLFFAVLTAYGVYRVYQNVKNIRTIKTPDNNYFDKYSDLLNISSNTNGNSAEGSTNKPKDLSE